MHNGYTFGVGAGDAIQGTELARAKGSDDTGRSMVDARVAVSRIGRDELVGVANPAESRRGEKVKKTKLEV